MCSSSTGQVYARGGTYNGRFAIMYAWYMPKDSPSTGLGHRHDWESSVVWLSAQSTSATIVGGAASAHGDFDTTTSPNLSGNSMLIRYFSIWPVNHQYVADPICGFLSSENSVLTICLDLASRALLVASSRLSLGRV